MPDRMPALDESFARRYEATGTGRLATPSDLVYFPKRPALTVEIEAEQGAPWSGAFGADHDSYLTGLFTTPDDRTVCVVSGGAGYFVDTTTPDSWFSVACTPIRIALPFPKHGLLVFGNFTDFVAYRAQPDSVGIRLEVAWRSARLGWDDLSFVQATDDRIDGQAWNAPNDRMIGFSLDVQTGEHEGGAYPRGD